MTGDALTSMKLTWESRALMLVLMDSYASKRRNA